MSPQSLLFKQIVHRFAAGVRAHDPGYPLPGKIRQARFPLPRGTDWKGLKLEAEIEVKGVRHPVRWACHQVLEEDVSLRLRHTAGLG